MTKRGPNAVQGMKGLIPDRDIEEYDTYITYHTISDESVLGPTISYTWESHSIYGRYLVG